MACNDKKTREFMNVPDGSIYELSVTGPAGFAAFAQFDDARNNKIEDWPAGQVTPGPKRKTVKGVGTPDDPVVHAVLIFVNIDPTMDIEVTVKASLNGKDYCRIVTGKGTHEIIFHTIRMA